MNFRYPILVSALVLASSNAWGISYTDTVNYVGENLGLPIVGRAMGGGPLSSVAGLFDITDSGYNPTFQNLLSATATFTFGDVLGNETISITLNGGAFHTQVDLLNGGLPTGAITVVPGSAGDDVTGAAFTALDSTGKLSYLISRVSGTYFLRTATLTAEAVTVPDSGSTLGFAGLGLGVMSFLLRRRA